jgi:bifunctional non-homologous end joining protein LigD
MLASTGNYFTSEEHLYEVKWDGLRCLVRYDKQGVTLMSRNARNISAAFPELTTIDQQVDGDNWMIDCELIALNSQGKPEFDLVRKRNLLTDEQRIHHEAQMHPATLIAFDLLYLNDQSLQNLPLNQRRQTLTLILSSNERIQLSPAKIGAGQWFHQAVVQQGMEGTMIKDLQSAYLPGQRTKHWIKVRHVRQSDCVICGFIPKGTDSFQSLLVGQYRADGQLVYVGHVGTGFTNRLQTELSAQLRKLRQDSTPVDIPYAAAKRAQWVRPVLVCVIEHLTWTADHILRHPVFRGVRQDKLPEECLLEP